MKKQQSDRSTRDPALRHLNTLLTERNVPHGGNLIVRWENKLEILGSFSAQRFAIESFWIKPFAHALARLFTRILFIAYARLGAKPTHSFSRCGPGRRPPESAFQFHEATLRGGNDFRWSGVIRLRQ